jgi:hypothetical protein
MVDSESSLVNREAGYGRENFKSKGKTIKERSANYFSSNSLRPSIPKNNPKKQSHLTSYCVRRDAYRENEFAKQSQF